MSTSFRTVFAVLMIGGALVAAAAAPTSASGGVAGNAEYVGTWITWYETPQGLSPCTRLYVAAENESTLEGMWAAPGWNRLVRGTVQDGRAGVVWRGEWRDLQSSGRFQFTLGAPDVPAEQFEGTYTADGVARAWHGAREVEGQAAEVPCRWTS
jgi:hypothetical protein